MQMSMPDLNAIRSHLGDSTWTVRVFDQVTSTNTMLKELGYDSYVTIEREISGEQQDEDIRHAKVYLETIINEVYGG